MMLTDFLQHLNTQQPTIRFTMKTENDNTIPCLNILVVKDSEGASLQLFTKNLRTLISTCAMTPTTLNQLNMVLPIAYAIDRKISSLN